MCKSSNGLSRVLLIDRTNLYSFQKFNIIMLIYINIHLDFNIKMFIYVPTLVHYIISTYYSILVVFKQFGVIPDPFPNSEVKPKLVDDTGYIYSWESRLTLPILSNVAHSILNMLIKIISYILIETRFNSNILILIKRSKDLSIFEEFDPGSG